jgi:ATP-dependent Lon protease
VPEVLKFVQQLKNSGQEVNNKRIKRKNKLSHSGINEIILPEGNIPDIKKLPEHIKKGIAFHFASKYKDVFEIVFEN